MIIIIIVTNIIKMITIMTKTTINKLSEMTTHNSQLQPDANQQPIQKYDFFIATDAS